MGRMPGSPSSSLCFPFFLLQWGRWGGDGKQLHQAGEPGLESTTSDAFLFSLDFLPAPCISREVLTFH